MDSSEPYKKISEQIGSSVRRLLSQQDHDRYSPTRGCFDRRYWGWKLIDFPESTFQRNVHPLAVAWADPGSPFYRDPDVFDAVLTGLEFASHVQHGDGSFDQAFPNEHSFAATGFLLHSLCEAYKIVCQGDNREQHRKAEKCLLLASDFLCSHDEKHGIISNHLAGASLSLIMASDLFAIEKYRDRGLVLLKHVLKHQSSEGWFLEYDGADPGYQTLCLYYLAKIYHMAPTSDLEKALERAIGFLAHFVHPDGTFGGEYGSRRTAIYYPGGMALLSGQFPLALSITRAMVHSISEGNTGTLVDIDMGNLAPLLSNYICLQQAEVFEENAEAPPLPCEEPTLQLDLHRAGIFIRGTAHYYAVFGASNGGVLKVFDKLHRQLLWDDCGYVGKTTKGLIVSSQTTLLDQPCHFQGGRIEITRDFYRVLHSLPSPLRFVVFRIANLILMRSLRVGNLVKKALVQLLISGKNRCEIQLQRSVRFETSKIIVEDRLTKSRKLKLRWLELGRRFVGIHMASAKYFQGAQAQLSAPKLDLERFNREHQIDLRIVIDC